MERRREESLSSLRVFLPGVGSDDEAQVKRSTRGMALRLYELILVSYSAGDSVEDLRRIAAEAIRWNCAPVYGLESVNQYQDFARLAALARLLHLEDELALLREVLERIPPGERDVIIESLVLGESRTATNDYRFGSTQLQEVLAAKDSGIASLRLKDFVQNQWYPAHTGNWWHDTHTEDYYNGYWCFEGAGVAKIMGLETSDWNIDYWPADLL